MKCNRYKLLILQSVGDIMQSFKNGTLHLTFIFRFTIVTTESGLLICIHTATRAHWIHLEHTYGNGIRMVYVYMWFFRMIVFYVVPVHLQGNICDNFSFTRDLPTNHLYALLDDYGCTVLYGRQFCDCPRDWIWYTGCLEIDTRTSDSLLYVLFAMRIVYNIKISISNIT